MRYWIVKGRPSENDLLAWLRPGRADQWHTGRPPKAWAVGDRLFFWEAAPKLRIAGLGVLTGLPQKRRAGDVTFHVRYLTRYIRFSPTLAELKQDPVIQTAAFVKSGPSGTVFPISDDQARRLVALLVRDNPELNTVWPDLEEQFVPDVDSPEMVATEGRATLLAHLARERDRRIVEAKKREVLQATGKLVCEACGFDFEQKYGERGREFCEVHHRKSLAAIDGLIQTKLSDLAVVCSNCHRMIHRRLPMLTVEEIGALARERSITSR